MSFANKHNSENTKLFTFEIPSNFEYCNLAELVKEHGLDKVHKVNALFINTKGKFGDAPTIVTDTALVNAPQHLTETVKEIMKDGESVSTINNGHAGFKVYTYKNQFGDQYALEWVDIK